MSEPLTVRTSFNDISELAQGYVNRVTAEQIILPAPALLTEGEWLQFIVILKDGTPAFAGVGCCIGVADRGQRADPELRYELVLDSLGFEDDSRAVFDHMVLVRDAMLGPQEEIERSPSQPEDETLSPDQAEISERAALEERVAEAGASEQDPAEEAQEQPAVGLFSEPDAAGFPSEPEIAAAEAEAVVAVGPLVAVAEAETDDEDDDLRQLDARTGQADGPPEERQTEPEPGPDPTAYEPEETLSEPPESEPPLSEPPLSEPPLPEPPVAAAPAETPEGTILTRRAIAWFWQPQPDADAVSYPASGLFEYGSDALPIPASPPRPELDPSLWIRPAPRPSLAVQPMPAETSTLPPSKLSQPPDTSSLPPGIATMDTDTDMVATDAVEGEPVGDPDGTVSQSEEGEVAETSDAPETE